MSGFYGWPDPWRSSQDANSQDQDDHSDMTPPGVETPVKTEPRVYTKEERRGAITVSIFVVVFLSSVFTSLYFSSRIPYSLMLPIFLSSAIFGIVVGYIISRILIK